MNRRDRRRAAAQGRIVTQARAVRGRGRWRMESELGEAAMTKEEIECLSSTCRRASRSVTPSIDINREPARVTWRDKDILVIGDNDVRKIITSNDEGGLLCFICGDADNATKYEVTKISDEGFVVSAKSERDQK
jgi:hypothetical protein